ncbi:MAG: major capsid protein [Xanthomonadaceae bacterium]|nr:major capsid protein [Xanthomonadaceae bacterium]MDZ4114404.1 major capsid protein [Xanthomonadaceae bacterium]
MRPGNVGQLLFPVAPVRAYGGKIIEFGREAFRLYNSHRAPGANTKRIDFGYSGKPYAIVPRALEAVVPRENQNDAQQVPGIDLAAEAIDLVLDSQQLENEVDDANIARNAANYDANHKVALVGTARWTGAAGDPSADINAAKEAIRASIGVRPNTVVLSPSAFAACETNAKIIDRLKYTGRDSVTVELLAKLWNVQTVAVGDAVVATGQNDDFGDVWGDDVIVAYVAPAGGGSSRSQRKPSFGYRYTIVGMPLVEPAYWDNSAKSWVYGVSNDSAPVLSGMTAGYLIQNAGGPAA